ncbi:MAG: GNAT family N-acetyltransferase [Acidobacteriaceae bacterium]|nr:GNAT family N-acetyltransferase [Acidobacteriaceae bacterium]
MDLPEGVTLRGYLPGDFEAMFRLDEVCFEPEFRFSKLSMRRFAEAKRARVGVAVAGESLAGFAITHIERAPTGSAGYVVTLDVAPAWRRRGLAQALMSQAETVAREAGCGALLLHVYVGNEGAIRFYEWLGFERGHTVEAFYGDGLDAMVYRKRLG